MKKIIALYGRGNIGKTNTLNYLIGQLEKSKEVYGDDLNKDRRVILSYRNKRIAITTSGDIGSNLEENISFFKKGNCDILVTATRTRGATVDTLKRYANENNTEIIWIKKNISASLNFQENEDQAREIKNVIDSL